MRILKTTVEYAQKKPWKTAEEMEECCCGDCITDPCAMVRCEETASPWFGYTYEELIEKTGIIVDENGFDQSGRRVIFRPVNHRPGRCGDNITKMGDCHSCCEDATPMEWDGDNSAQSISPNAWGYVFVTGGRGPYSWSLRGSGFFFDDFSGGRYREAETETGGIAIFASPEACGTAKIEVNDGCSTASGAVRSTNGHWETVYGCDDPGMDAGYVESIVEPWIWIVTEIDAGTKIKQGTQICPGDFIQCAGLPCDQYLDIPNCSNPPANYCMEIPISMVVLLPSCGGYFADEDSQYDGNACYARVTAQDCYVGGEPPPICRENQLSYRQYTQAEKQEWVC